MTAMPETIQEMLWGDKRRRHWSYNQAAPALDTTAQTVQQWVKEGVIPKRERIPHLARFLERTEQEIRDAVAEAEKEQKVARDLQAQLDDMRTTMSAINTRVDALMQRFEDILDRLPPARQ